MGKQEVGQVLGALARLTAATVRRLQSSRSLLVPCIATLPLGLQPSIADELAPPAAANSVVVTLPVTAQGSWQVIQLPLNWRRKYLKEPWPREVAIALMTPTAAEIGADNAPCGPPQSVVLIATSDAGRTRTKTLLKGEFCSSRWQPPPGMSWASGPRIAIESIAVDIAPNGGLVITYMIKRDVGHSDTPASNSAQRGSWKETLLVAQIQGIVEAR